MPKYTEEQIERAKNTDVRSFLEQTEGFTFSQSGHYLKCKDPERTGQPSSLTVDLKMNRIFYNTATGNRPMSALDWCREIKNMDFQSAMQLVLGESPQGERVEKPKFQTVTPHQHTEETKKEFALPESGENSKHVYMYLTATRGIPSHIVNSCLKNGLIMEDNRRNAVFIGYDDENNARYGARRGTFTPNGAEPFKRDVSGSDKNFAFKLIGKNTDTIYVTEAAIDALSLAAIEDKFNGDWAFKEKTYISTGGAGIDSAIEQFCKTHEVKTINICFDNDEAGKNGAEKIMQKYREMGYEVNDMRATLAHDYNDELVAFNRNPQFYPEPPKTVSYNRETERNDVMPEMSHTEPPKREVTEMPEPEPPATEGMPYYPPPVPPYPPIDEQTQYPEDNFDHYIPIDDMDVPPIEPVADKSEKTLRDDITEQVNEFGMLEISKEQYDTLTNGNAVTLGSYYYEHKDGDQYWDDTTRITAANGLFFGYVSDRDGETYNALSKDEAEKLLQEAAQSKDWNITAEGKEIIANAPEQNIPAAEDNQSIPHEPVQPTEQKEVLPSHDADLIYSPPVSRRIPETSLSEEEHKISDDIILSTESYEDKMNFLLSALKSGQEEKRADLLDKLDSIDGKIAMRQEKIDKLNEKIADLETSLKTHRAFKRAFGNTAIGSLIDTLIEKKQAKIAQIKDEKIPKQQEKIDKQSHKREKTLAKLGKVNRKIEKIDKVQDFFTAIGSKDREVRHQGFVTGLENLNDFRRESLDNKAQKIETRINNLSAEYNSSDLSNSEKLNIRNKIISLKKDLSEIRSKIQDTDKLHKDLTEIKDGRFTDIELDKTVDKAADIISEKLENPEISDSGIVDHIIGQSVEAGNEAINQTAADKNREQVGKNAPEREQERTPDNRQPNVSRNVEQGILIAAAAITGIDISEINRLPAEIKAEIISEFQLNGGSVSSEQLAEKIYEIAEIEPPEIIKPKQHETTMQEQGKEKENPLRELEETIEMNADFIDGIINNLPPDKPEERETAERNSPLFSRKRVMDGDFTPKSSKTQEEIERDKEKRKDRNIGI